MKVVLTIIVTAIFALPTLAQNVTSGAPNVNLPGVRLRLVLADNKTSFRIGEAVKLFLEFTADRGGYRVEVIPDRQQPTNDKIVVSPDGGVFHWLEESMGGTYSRDYFGLEELTSAPLRVPLVLNDTLRFDQPGQYTVKVLTTRVEGRSNDQTDPHNRSRPIELETNSVSFEMLPMSETDEQKEVKRLGDLLDASTNAQTREALAVELSFLTGDASTREKVRRMLNPATNNNNVGQIGGLFIARNRSLVLQLLEAGIRDPKITVDSSLLWDVSRIRFLRETSGLPRSSQQFSVVGLMPSEDPRMQQIRDSYLTELVAGLSKRTGKNQTTTAMTILMNLPKDAQASDVMLREIRQVLIPQFDTLHPFTQEALLSRYWDQLRDPSLVPSMKKLLSYEGVANKNIHDASLKRLIEMSPEEAHPFVVAEIRNPRSLVNREILAMISDRSLPEVDESLLAQVRQLANSSERSAFVYMDYKTSLLARFASDSIYQDLMRLYRELGEGVSIESRAGMVAYFASHNGDEATPLIEETISKFDAQKASRFLTKLTAFFYSDEIGKILKKRLESDVPEEASTAAYLIGKHGAADDQKNLEARLRRWRDEWKGRIEEGNNDLQGTIEREVVYALIHGQGWKLTPDRIRELQLGCISKYCRLSNQLK